MRRKYIFKYGMPDDTIGYEEANVELDVLDTISDKYTDYYLEGIITWWDYDEI